MKNEIILHDQQEAALAHMLNEIAKFVDSACVAQGLTTYALAKRTGVSWSAVDSIRHGKITKFDRVVRVVSALGGQMIVL